MIDGTTCKHCKKKLTNKNSDFCSSKCEDIFNLLKEQHLDSFYTKRESFNIEQSDIISSSDIDYCMFDTQAFKEEFITTTPQGYSQAKFYIKGITCFACVWLNENILLKQDGIIEVDVNMAYKSAHIVWDSSLIKVSDIIKTINSIGYGAFAYTQDIAQEQEQEEKQDYMAKLWVGFFASCNVMMIDVAKYSGIFTNIHDDTKFAMHVGELVLASLALFYSGSIFLKKAYLGLKNKVINMEFLVYFGALLSYVYSLWILFGDNSNLSYSYAHETYFDSCAMIISFVLVGKYLEILAKAKSSSMLKKISAMPAMINTLSSLKDTKPVAKLSRLIIKDDLICIKPNDRLVIDGELVKGSGYFDTSVVNGESKKVLKSIGDKLVSGFVYHSSNTKDETIVYKATCNVKESFLGKLNNILQNKDILKHQYEQKIAIIASYFTITILGLALFTFLYWSYTQDSYSALVIAISVIVISCPCSLALAVPISSIVALNNLIKNNIITLATSSLDKIKSSKYFVFDKTNTLTYGNFEVIKCNIKQEHLSNILALSKNSNHLVSMAISSYLSRKHSCANINIKDFKQISSRGISAKIDNNIYLLGNYKFMQESNIVCNSIDTNTSVCYVAKNNELLGHFELEDTIKDEAQEVINTLKQKGIKCLILSGDNEQATKAVANKLDIAYHANMSVEDKKEFIKNLKKQNNTQITMIGDGLNDILALNESDVSISFSSSDNLTIKASDILLNNSNLRSLISLIDISNTYATTIKQNLALSFSYNSILIPVAIMGYISPLIAALCMSLSSLLVVLNSIRKRKAYINL